MFKKLLFAVLSLCAAAAFAAVDVNKADKAQLETIKGVGPVTADKILDERKKGAFKSWEDLVGRVKGVGDTSAAKLSEAGLTVNGQTYQAPAPKKEDKMAKKEEKPAAKDMKKDPKKEEAKK